MDAAHLAFMERLRVLRIAALAVVALAALFRARWTVIAHLLPALLPAGALAGERHDWEKSHTAPGYVRYRAGC
ncbi:DUF6234 family protein [Streptomyces griseoluteus]|uniref:DUF6234 family protein n=1 Tax=Streptomyces griseoluteus TaxID=29306 RepID=UPI00382935F9